jgi:hypothetical protein
MIPKSVQRFSEKIMLKQEASVARTEGSRNPGQGVMPLITRHHGEIATRPPLGAGVARTARDRTSCAAGRRTDRRDTHRRDRIDGSAQRLVSYLAMRRPDRLARNVDFAYPVPRIFVDSVTRISYNSSSLKICVGHRLAAGRFAVCQSTAARRGAVPARPELGPDPCSSPPALRVFRAKRRRACAVNRSLWQVNIMDGPVRERPPAGR